MVCSFLTNDKIHKYISNMGKNLSPYSVATGSENYYLLAPNFSFIKTDKIDYDTILDGICVPDSGLPFDASLFPIYSDSAVSSFFRLANRAHNSCTRLRIGSVVCLIRSSTDVSVSSSADVSVT